MRIKFDEKTIKKIEEITMTDYDVVDNTIDAEMCASIIEDLVFEFESLQDEYNDYIEKVEDRY